MEEKMECDYCPGTFCKSDPVCNKCGYDYSDLLASGGDYSDDFSLDLDDNSSLDLD